MTVQPGEELPGEPLTPGPISANGSAPAMATSGHRRISHKRIIAAVALAVVALTLGGAAFVIDPRTVFDAESTSDASPPRDTTTASRADLREDYAAEGALVYGNATTFTHEGAASTLTELVSTETIVTRGDVLWRAGNEPTVVFYGELPAYRELAQGDVGPDVGQLEVNLTTLGYDPDHTVTVDDTYTANTAVMVERWQDDLGAAVTGRVTPSSIVYLPGPSRVGALDTHVGDTLQPGAAVLETTSQQRLVEFSVPAQDQESLAVGLDVDVTLPDRSAFAARLTELRLNEDGSLTVVAEPLEPTVASADTVPISVAWSVGLGVDVLTVPAAALLRTDAGRYFVEVVDDSQPVASRTELVPVEVGRRSGMTVEVIGDVAEGDIVVAP